MSIIVGTPDEVGISDSSFEAFFAKHWVRPIALSDHKFAKWQFASPPAANGRNQSIVAFDTDQNAVAGIMGLNPRPFFLGDEQVNGAELTTWIVAEGYRSSGAGAKIVTEIMSRYDALIGMGISSMALPIYRRLGFRYLRAIPRFVRVLDVEKAAQIGNISALGRRLIRMDGAEPQSFVLRSADSPSEMFERSRQRLNLFSRDAEHLQWRYQTHPYFKYELFNLSSGGGEAFVAVRMETSVTNLRVLHVTDCFGDEVAMPGAIAFIQEYAKAENADFCDFYCTSAKLNRFFLAANWHSVLDDLDVQLPHLFHPVEMRDPPTTSLIYWSKGRMTEMADFGRLYITKQDADFDRPVLVRA
jgi:hypothetical protein